MWSSIATTMVLSILSLTTLPTRVFLKFLSTVMFSFQTLSQFRFLCNNSLNSSDILANLFDSAGII